MIRIYNFRVKVKENIDLYEKVCSRYKIPKESIKSLKIHKKSLDARSEDVFSYVFNIDLEVDDEKKYLNKYIKIIEPEKYSDPEMGSVFLKNRPVIVGAGPAGLFCAYELAKRGFKPIVLERGEKIEDRVKTVDKFWKENKFNAKSNVQFGEGGAGTFSDGKLNTLVTDRENRMKEVFQVFVDCGAKEEIMYDNKPHIGTDVLRKVIINLRNKIISLGGEIRYNSFVEDLIIENNEVKKVIVNGEILDTDVVIFAIGHSARDTFKMLYNKRLKMEAKPFAIGVRIMHPQEMINENQYPINYPFLPAASYKLTYKTLSGRGVYSFCMCPGGYVVDARSYEDGIVVNGMSNSKRDSSSANSAIVVTINPSDFGTNVFDGVNLQESIEKKAFALGSGHVPVQKYLDYKNNQVSEPFDVKNVMGQVSLANINDIFPDYINESIKEGIDYFGTKIKGFDGNEAIILAPEARTSSPVRILRDEELESNIKGIYPIGEGAGYAGGITTSAMDGIKASEVIIKKYSNKNLL